jgi:large subunit ribosomal protein L15
MKGQRSRSGHGIRPGFEGGQLPLVKALPSIRGFTNNFRTHYHLVNLDRLAKFPADSQVSPTTMLDAGIVKDLKRPVKVLGRGELSSPLVVEAHRFSASARSKIEAAGGRAMEIS